MVSSNTSSGAKNATTVTNDKPKELSEILRAAGRRALGGGLPGAMAMGIQVGSLMWLRTTMNYQYRHGTSTTQALKHLYNEGGIRRFYRGIAPALIQGPMSRFGDTAANAGVLSLLDESESTKNLPVAIKTAMASGAAALWRINLMPVDTMKTMLQVEGAQGLGMLKNKFKKSGPRVFYHGAIAASSATFVGHFPWFFTFNFLNETLPKPESLIGNLSRNAFMGFCASAISDTTSNSIRVIKTYKQTSGEALTYIQAAKNIISEEGLVGLFGRGLKTRILANGVQGLVFAVLWKQIQATFFAEQSK